MASFLPTQEQLYNHTLDTSSQAKTTPERELRMLMYAGTYYKQVKHYKGMYCLGVSWEFCDELGKLI